MWRIFLGHIIFLYSDIPDIEKVESLIAAYKVHDYLIHNRSHSKGPTSRPYEAYKILYPDGAMKAKQFQSVYSFVNQIELNPKEFEVSKDSIRAVDLWKGQGESVQHIYEYICKICTDPRSALQMDCLHLPEECDYGKRHKAFMEAFDLIGRNPSNRVDAVCAAYLNRDNHDILIENLYTYFAFTSAIDITDKNAKALIVGASPYYIRRWLRDGVMAKIDATFVFEDCNIRDVFLLSAPTGGRVHYISIDELRKAPIMYDSKYVMVFGNHAQNGYLDLIREIKQSATTKHVLLYLGPDMYITARSSQLYQMLREEDMKLIEVTLLPAGIHNATNPQRKMLSRCEYGYIDKQSEETIHIKSYSLDTSGAFQNLTQKPYIETQTLADFQKGGESFRNVYRSGELVDLQKTASKRQIPEEYRFSEEIVIYATASMPNESKDHKLRVEAYVKTAGSPATKGDRLEASIKRTKKIRFLELEHWATKVYPYESVIRDKIRYSIREIIGAEYRGLYKSKPITLKTLVYIYPEIEEDASKIGKTRLYELVESDLGNVVVTYFSSAFVCSVLNLLYPSADQEQAWLQARRVLADALDVAVSNGHCERNEIRDEIKRDTADHAVLQIVRNNLRKQSFSIPELRKIYELIRAKIDHGQREFLGVLICMLCGLESNVVCALKWGDLNLINGFSFRNKPIYQLSICRQLRNDGTDYKNFEKAYSFRLLPCHYLLAELLLEERARQRERKEYLTDDVFALESIIQGPTMVFAGKDHVLAPQELSRLCREVIRSVGIPDQIIPIPDDGKGTTESNLVNYSIDFFRSNYRHYGIRTCMFDPGELAYLLGNKGPTTFDRNYCDYVNDKSQLILLIKQDRWISLLTPKKTASGKHLSLNKVSAVKFAAHTEACSDIEVMITVPKDSSLKITVESEYGVSGFIEEAKEVMPDGSI